MWKRIPDPQPMHDNETLMLIPYYSEGKRRRLSKTTYIGTKKPDRSRYTKIKEE